MVAHPQTLVRTSAIAAERRMRSVIAAEPSLGGQLLRTVSLLLFSLSICVSARGQDFRDHSSIVQNKSVEDSSVHKHSPPFAIKTNLLFDAVTAVNIGAELPLGPRWSINAEWTFPWWLPSNNTWCIEMLSGTLEGRYWFGKDRRRMLGGGFVGLYAGGGYYDFQKDLQGYQGEFYIMSGISAGWSFRIADNFNLELSLGCGYLRTDYRHYEMKEDYTILAWQYDGRYEWIGPTKAEVTLVWLIGRKSYERRAAR